jgi:excisionase family DNA binding protein
MGKDARWLTIGEAAKRLGVSRDTLRRWEKAGKIKPTRSPTNRRYYTKETLDQLMGGTGKKRKKPPVAESGRKMSSATRIILAAILSSIAAVLIAFSILFFLAN